MIKVLAAGAFSVPYIWNNWGSVLKEHWSDRVTLLNINKLASAYSKEELVEYVIYVAKNNNYTHFFLYFDWIFELFDEDFYAAIRSAGIKTVVFFPDDEPEHWFSRNYKYDDRWDIVVSHSLNGIKRRMDLGRDSDSLVYMQWGYNPEVCGRDVCPAHAADIVFVGKNKVYKHDNALFTEDGEIRERLLRRISAEAERNRWDFRLYGFGWDLHPVLSKHYHGMVQDSEMNQIFSSAKVVFNPAWSSDPASPSPQTKLRHFEVLGCGGFQVTNYNQELESCLADKNSLVFFDDEDDLIGKLEYFLSNDERRNDIAKRGQLIAEQSHTTRHRLNYLMNELERKYSSTHSCPGKTSPRKVVVTDASSILLGGQDGIDPETLYVLRHEDNLVDFQLDESLLPCDVLGDKDFYISAPLMSVPIRPDNPVQPRLDECFSLVLWNRSVCSSQAAPLRSRLESDLSWVEIDDGTKHFASSIFITGAYLKANLALLQGEGRAFFANGHYAYWPQQIISFSLKSQGFDLSSIKLSNRPAYISSLASLLTSFRDPVPVVIYGARGQMAERVFLELRHHSHVLVEKVIDNGMVGKTVGGYVVESGDALAQSEAELIIIAAEFSGKAIYESLNAYRVSKRLVPLYDLEHPAWTFLAPTKTFKDASS